MKKRSKCWKCGRKMVRRTICKACAKKERKSLTRLGRRWARSQERLKGSILTERERRRRRS